MSVSKSWGKKRLCQGGGQTLDCCVNKDTNLLSGGTGPRPPVSVCGRNLQWRPQTNAASI